MKYTNSRIAHKYQVMEPKYEYKTCEGITKIACDMKSITLDFQVKSYFPLIGFFASCVNF